MKKLIYLGVMVLAVICSSCNKDLTIAPPSSGTTSTFYLSQSDFIQGTNAIYNSLRSYPDRLINLSETRSDNLYAVSVLGTQNYTPINSFNTGLVSNTYVEAAWNDNYNGIFRANELLQQLAKNGSTYIPSAPLRNRLQAEAQYLRAFMYFDLVRYFGKVPVTTVPVTAAEAVKISRSPVADVYKVIIADLQFAIQNLPATYTGTDVGRATKYAAESLLAMVYMARSGPTYNIEGPGLGSNEWELAITLLNDVINSGQFALSATYANIFAYANQNPAVNKEAVFDVMYNSGLTPVLGASFVSLTVPDAYFTSVLVKPAELGGQGRPTSDNLYNSYESADARKSFNFILYFTQLGIPGNRPYLKKYLDATKVPTVITDWGINFIAIRYTDILMLKAECILHGATGTQADVDAIVKQVRNRSGASTLTNVTLDQLYDERKREFIGEGSRWFDLQRSGKLVETMNAWIASDDVLKQILPVVPNYIIYPVPQSQLDAQPGLYTQNPGY